MRLSGKVLSALGGLALSVSITHPASAGGTPGGIDGAQLTTAELDFAGPAVDVDLELILAVDVSGSISADELELERSGYVAAFRDPDVIAAIANAELGAVAVTYFEWAGPDYQKVLVPWSVLSDIEDIADFAARLEAAPVSPPGDAAPWRNSTAMSIALLYAARLMGRNDLVAIRRVIDISGDGPNDSSVPIGVARDFVLSHDITINGLPILRGPQFIKVDRYYANCVVGGPGSFSIVVSRTSDFPIAIRRKLVQEIAGLRGVTRVAFQEFYRVPNECDRWSVGSSAPPWAGLD